jgi:serine protease SohB
MGADRDHYGETDVIDIRRHLPGPLRRRPPIVPVVRLQGPIGALGGGRGALSIAGLEETLRRAFSVGGAVAVALAVNSPGGAPAQSNLIHRRIRELAAEKDLPVIAYVEDVAASGGYMLALAADEIVVDPSSIVGSIGVVSAGFGFDRAIDKLGIDRRVHTAGVNKATLDPFRPEVAEEVEYLKAIQADIHAMFIDLVRTRRGGRLVETDDTFTGRFWTGGKAVELGLADRIGTAHEDLVRRFGDKVEVKPLSRGGFLSRRLFGPLSGTRLPPVVSADEVIGALDARALYARYGM